MHIVLKEYVEFYQSLKGIHVPEVKNQCPKRTSRLGGLRAKH
jgi:hypothetical protein